jgi:hypothetical protein
MRYSSVQQSKFFYFAASDVHMVQFAPIFHTYTEGKTTEVVLYLSS